MPKISDEIRQQRRAQILDAAWRCFYREGVQATTMEEIIREAGMSASAMYRYFANKEDIIFTAMTTSLSGLATLLAPILQDPQEQSPAEFIERVLATIDKFTTRRGFNLASIAIHGWSEAQRDDKVRLLLNDFYLQFRQQLRLRVVRWQASGEIRSGESPDDVAKTLHSIILGYVVQAAVMRDMDAKSHARGLAALAHVPGQSRPKSS